MGFLERFKKNKGEDKLPIDEYRERHEKEDRDNWKRQRKRVNTEKARRLAGGAVKSLYNSFGDMKDAMSDTSGRGKPPISQMNISRSMGFNIDVERMKAPGMPKGGLDFTNMGMGTKKRRRAKRR